MAAPRERSHAEVGDCGVLLGPRVVSKEKILRRHHAARDGSLHRDAFAPNSPFGPRKPGSVPGVPRMTERLMPTLRSEQRSPTILFPHPLVSCGVWAKAAPGQAEAHKAVAIRIFIEATSSGQSGDAGRVFSPRGNASGAVISPIFVSTSSLYQLDCAVRLEVDLRITTEIGCNNDQRGVGTTITSDGWRGARSGLPEESRGPAWPPLVY
jgi:hypothetical protein